MGLNPKAPAFTMPRATPSKRISKPSPCAVGTPTATVAAPRSGSRQIGEGLFTSDSVDSWFGDKALHKNHNGLLIKRPFHKQWDEHQAAVDDALARVGIIGLAAELEVKSVTAASVELAIGELLATAALPAPLSEQVRRDACLIAPAVAAMCPWASSLDLKVELFGNSICPRWHMDNYVGRAIVSYTGGKGTEYVRDSNVDFWELEHCGNNDCIILDKGQTECIEVGDILFMKGRAYKGAHPLVHKSPTPQYHANGRVLHRLILKVDVNSF